jgi:hypothetical protein
LNYSKLEQYLSPARINRFLAAGGTKDRAMKLYRINLRVSQAFYPLLNLFEIFLRNAVDQQLTIFFNNPGWIIIEKNGFMNSPTLQRSRFFLRNQVQKAERDIAKRGGTITAGNVIAEQTFGFWTSFFDSQHYRLIGGCPIHCFQHKPSSTNRKIINTKLHSIRDFRNRIYHNEPICFNGTAVDFKKAQDIKDTMYELLGWIEPDLTGYVDYFNCVEAKILTANNL